MVGQCVTLTYNNVTNRRDPNYDLPSEAWGTGGRGGGSSMCTMHALMAEQGTSPHIKGHIQMGNKAAYCTGCKLNVANSDRVDLECVCTLRVFVCVV